MKKPPILLVVLIAILFGCDKENDPDTPEPNLLAGTLYIGGGGSGGGIFYAIDLETGTKKWEFVPGDAVYSTPTAVNEVVYFASWDKKIYALDARTGTKKWESKPSEVAILQPFAAPLVVNNVLYYGGENYFYALDATTGDKKWQYRDDVVYGWKASPTILNGIVYASIRGSGPAVGIYGLDAQTGAKKWKAAVTLVTESSPAIADGLLYAGFEYDGFNAFDINTGNTVWSAKTTNTTYSSPTVSNGIVYINAYASDGGNDCSLYAFDAKTGAQKWEFKMPGSGFGGSYPSPIVSNGVVYTAGLMLYALDAVSGAKKWEGKLSGVGSPQGGPVVAKGVVFQSSDKKVYAFDAATGSPKWEFEGSRFMGDTSPCVVLADGTVYHAGISGMVQ